MARKASKAGEAVSFTVTADGSAINAMIGVIKASADSLRSNIQNAAASCILHAIKHGDVTYAARLYDAVSRSGNRQSLASYFSKHGPIKVSTKNNAAGEAVADFKIISEKRELMLKADLGVTAAALMAQPWQEQEKEATFKGIDPEERVYSLIKSTRKIMEGKDDKRPKDHPGNKNFDLIDDLEAFMATRKANRILAEAKALVAAGNGQAVVTH
jgi:hypothetical protein